MKKLKDFIHDTNDILLAIVIVAIAAGIIFWRLNAILEYPAMVAEQNMHANENVEEQTDKDSARG